MPHTMPLHYTHHYSSALKHHFFHTYTSHVTTTITNLTIPLPLPTSHYLQQTPLHYTNQAPLPQHYHNSPLHYQYEPNHLHTTNHNETFHFSPQRPHHHTPLPSTTSTTHTTNSTPLLSPHGPSTQPRPLHKHN